MTGHAVQIIHDYGKGTVRAFCNTCLWKSAGFKFRHTAERWARTHARGFEPSTSERAA